MSILTYSKRNTYVRQLCTSWKDVSTDKSWRCERLRKKNRRTIQSYLMLFDTYPFHYFIQDTDEKRSRNTIIFKSLMFAIFHARLNFRFSLIPWKPWILSGWSTCAKSKIKSISIPRFSRYLLSCGVNL